MSRPKSSSVVVTQVDPAVRAERERRHREEQRARIARAAEQRERERMERREAERQRAQELMLAQEARRDQLRQAREAEREAEVLQRNQARVQSALARASTLAAEMERLDAWRRRLPNAVSSRLTVQPPQVGPQPPSDDVQDVEAWVNKSEKVLAEYVRQLMADVEQSTSHASQDDILSTLAGDLIGEAQHPAVLIESARSLIERRHGLAQSASRDERERLSKLFGRTSATLSSRGLPAPMREELIRQVTQLQECRNLAEVDAACSNVTALLTAADSQVAEAQRTFQALKVLADQWLAETGEPVPDALITAFSSDEAASPESYGAWLNQFSDGVARKRTIDAQLTTAQKEANRAFVASSLRQALENLGYEIEDIDHTLFTENGKVFATKPGWDGHFVEIRGGTGLTADQLDTRCVKVVDDGLQTDNEVDVEWCDDLHQAMKVLRDSGIAMRVESVNREAPPVANMDEATSQRNFVQQRRRRKTSQEASQKANKR
ncbi:hypothetical protein ABT392_07905 [Paucibacter sp. JuS9]|uniref:hypothetical protein n=1 Tax=Paucibacter sp. JuS9 TaxID=3228748 RepID=UPI003756EB5F